MMVSPFLHEFDYQGHAVKFAIISPNDFIQHVILKEGFYEKLELDKLRELCPSKMRILDVGANIGNHTLYFSKIMEADCVTVVEPHPIASTHLKCNIAINDVNNVDTSYLGIALGAALSCGATGPSFAGNLGSSQVISGSSFPIVPGDVLFSGSQFDLIKIDVEGGEMGVLHGLNEVIGRCRPMIFIEIQDVNTEEFAKWRGRMRYSIKWRHRRSGDHENFFLEPNT